MLEAKIDKFCADEEKYIDFLKRSNLWIKCHAEQLKNLLHLTAHYSDLNFTYDDFKAGLFVFYYILNCIMLNSSVIIEVSIYKV